jgi:hypothetical protein
MEATTKAEALMEFCILYAVLTRCCSTMSQALNEVFRTSWP